MVCRGIHAPYFSTNWFAITVGKNSKGEQTLVNTESRPATKINGHYTDPGIAFLTTFLQVIGIVLALLSTFFDEALGAVVAAALLVALVGQFAIKTIGQANQGDAPALDDLMTNFTSPITWTSTEMKLSNCGLHGSLQLGEDFV